ncbi:MAG: hypothetical protein QMD85_05340, partial [Candidatus Aenigmarchaeota archaeon]|nr:hypothetical protein [Candidatus Aenigmarchaeota archaeon]MDI6722991.1 hypothetical protein [Candidatus Aenigmarchaeota archaeon]
MKKLISVYIVLILISVAYLLSIEGIMSTKFVFNAGGRDTKFSFYDMSIIGVGVFSAILTAVSTLSYGRKRSRKLFLISMAFFIFTLRSFFDLVSSPNFRLTAEK